MKRRGFLAALIGGPLAAALAKDAKPTVPVIPPMPTQELPKATEIDATDLARDDEEDIIGVVYHGRAAAVGPKGSI